MLINVYLFFLCYVDRCSRCRFTIKVMEKYSILDESLWGQKGQVWQHQSRDDVEISFITHKVKDSLDSVIYQTKASIFSINLYSVVKYVF